MAENLIRITLVFFSVGFVSAIDVLNALVFVWS
jgi:hypothetical protein